MARLVAENPGILEAVFTQREVEYGLGTRRWHEHLSARFGAKEAVLKAFGTGLGRRMCWTDVEIVHDAAGRPRVCLHGAVADWAQRHGGYGNAWDPIVWGAWKPEGLDAIRAPLAGR